VASSSRTQLWAREVNNVNEARNLASLGSLLSWLRFPRGFAGQCNRDSVHLELVE
jgi:hypothetical protein